MRHPQFDQPPNGFWPRRQIELLLAPTVDGFEQSRLKASSDEGAGGRGTSSWPCIHEFFDRHGCFHVNTIPRDLASNLLCGLITVRQPRLTKPTLGFSWDMEAGAWETERPGA